MKKLYTILISFALIFLLFIPYENVNAANDDVKKIEVPIEKNYKSAKFTLTFDYYDNYSVLLISPSGKEYVGTLENPNSNIVQCIVEDVEVGQWEVVISHIATEESKEESTDESPETGETQETNESEVHLEPISPVKLQVEGFYESLSEVNKDISIATDIVGLKLYIKDTSLIIEWTDTTCGNVNIEVVNSKNMQKLDSRTVTGNYYECPIKEGVQEIMISVVPSVSSEIEGATNTYTIKTEYNPEVIVTYEDLVITNHDSLMVTCDMKQKYGVVTMVNDKQIEKTDLLDIGLHELEVPLDIGNNKIITYIVDEKGNMKSFEYNVVKDVVAPQLNLVSTYEDIVTEDEYITIEGAVADYDRLTINNVEVEVEGDSTFKYDYKLKEGINQIAIVASDLAGNEVEYVIAVERVIPEENPTPPIYTLIIFLIIGGIIVYILFSLRKNKRANNTRVLSAGGTEQDEEILEVPQEDEVDISDYDNVDISNLTPLEKKKIIRGQYFVWDILSFAVPLIAAYIVLSCIIFVSVIQSASMEPALKVGNTVFYNRLAYVRNEPQRGDAVVFYSEEYNEYFGKRIIGLPGDHIEFKDGYVVINDQYCDETAYISSEIETNCSKSFDVPQGYYFMLGDNREMSNDSRFWDEPYIPRDDIKGKYIGQIAFSFQYDIFGKIFGVGDTNDKIKQVEPSTDEVSEEDGSGTLEDVATDSAKDIIVVEEPTTEIVSESETLTEPITGEEITTESTSENETLTEDISEEEIVTEEISGEESTDADTSKK